MNRSPSSPALSALLASFLAFILTASTAPAATISWTGQTDNTWAGPNWIAVGSTTPLSGAALPNADAIFSSSNAAFQQATLLGSNLTLHSLTFEDPATMRVFGSGTLTIADDGSFPGYLRVEAAAGSVTVQNDLNLVAHHVTVEGSAQLRLEGDVHGPVLTKDGLGSLILAGALDSGMTLNVNGGTVYLLRSQTLGGLHIAAGATVMLAEHGPAEPNGTKVIDTAALTIDLAGGALDLTNNSLIVRGGSSNAYPAVLPLVQSGIWGGPLGYWDGPGIRSSTAAADALYVLALGLLDNADPLSGFTEFAGVTGLSPNDALLAFTYYGDADLDRNLTGTDEWLLGYGYDSGLTGGGWFWGDFDYNGVVDATDFFLFANSYYNQSYVSQYSDTDHDGMPDWWEMIHGFDWRNSSDASNESDADGDGVSNLGEYLADTDPNDVASCPYAVVSSIPSNGSLGHATNAAVLLYLNQPLPAAVTTLPAGIVLHTTNVGTTWLSVPGTTSVLPGGQCVAFLPAADFIPHVAGISELTYLLDFSTATTGLAHVAPLRIRFSVEYPDPAGPAVERVWPGIGFIDVARDFAPVIQWSQPLHPDTVLAAHVSLRAEGATSDLPVSLLFDYLTNRLTIAHATWLPDTLYTVTVSTELKNLMGLPLAESFTWSFRTRAEPPPFGASPHVTSMVPMPYSSAVAPDAPLHLVFSENMNGSTLSSATVHLQAAGTFSDVAASFSYSPSLRRLTITPQASLASGTRYLLMLDAAAILSSATVSQALGGQTAFTFITAPSGGGDDGGPGGGGGGGDPGIGVGGPSGGAGPDADSDGDGVKDHSDQYKNDKRRSSDLPKLNYAEIDISTPIIGPKNVTMVALDDQNQVAFSYLEEASEDAPGNLKVVLWKNGAQVGETHSYPLRANTSGGIPPTWTISPQFLNASGTIAGTATQTRPISPATTPPSYENKYCVFTQKISDSSPVFLHGEWGAAGYGGNSSSIYSASANGLTSTDIIWGRQSHSDLERSSLSSVTNFDFIGTKKFHFLHDPARPPHKDGPDDPGFDLGSEFAPELVNKNQQAVGQQVNKTAPYRYSTGTPVALTAKTAVALSDGGTIFGVVKGGALGPGFPSTARTPKLWTVTDGTPTDVTPLLPKEFRQQIAFTEATGAAITSTGDILFSTPVLEGLEENPAWNTKSVLWRRQTTTENPNGTLAEVIGAGGQLNKDLLTVAISQVELPAASGGAPPSTPHSAASVRLPVNITATSIDAPSTGRLNVGPYNGTPKAGCLDNLISVWPDVILTLKIVTTAENAIRADQIKWTVPDNTVPDGSYEAMLTWSDTGVKNISVQIAKSIFNVAVDVPNVGPISQSGALLSINPISAITILAKGKMAEDYTNKNYSPTGQRDAMRHSYWNALCNSDSLIAASSTHLVTTAHEWNNKWGYDHLEQPVQGQAAFNTTMDLHNNSVGAAAIHTSPDGLGGYVPDEKAILSDLASQFGAGQHYVWDGAGKQDQSQGILIKSNRQKIY